MTQSSLAALVEFARQRSPFYRELYADQPSAPVCLEALPIIDHARFWAANDFQNNTVATGPHTDGIVFKTGGTTGAPKVSIYTRDELRSMSQLWGSGFATGGLSRGDRVANLFYAGELYASFVFTLLCLHETPVPNVHLPIAGSASPDYVEQAVIDHDATVLMGPPTSLCQFASHVVGSVGELPKIRLIMFAGEAYYPDQRDILRAAFPNAEVRSLGYASIDAGMLGAPVADADDPRVHRTFYPSTLLEIVDPDTGLPCTEAGRPGRIIATDLTRRLTPVIRYPVGDLGEWVDFSAGVFRLLGRGEEGARVGPVTLYLEDLRAIVGSVAAGHRIVGVQVVQRRRLGKDELVVRVGANSPGTGELASMIADRLAETRPMFADHVQAGLINPVVVQVVRPGELRFNPRSGKLIPLIDER